MIDDDLLIPRVVRKFLSRANHSRRPRPRKALARGTIIKILTMVNTTTTLPSPLILSPLSSPRYVYLTLFLSDTHAAAVSRVQAGWNICTCSMRYICFKCFSTWLLVFLKLYFQAVWLPPAKCPILDAPDRVVRQIQIPGFDDQNTRDYPFWWLPS